MLLLLAILLSVDPHGAAVLLQHALVALKQGQIPEARSNLERASRLDPQNAYVWSALAEAYWRAKETKLASVAAKKAESTGSDNPVVCHALAMYYSESGQFSHAADMERRFAERAKADPQALSRAAELYLKAGEFKTGLELARKAQAQSPTALNEDLLAQALLADGQQADAGNHLQSAWEMDKSNGQIAFDWVQFLLRRGDFTGAADVANSFLAAHPNDAQMMLALGVTRYGQRRFDEAIVTFLNVIRIDPSVTQSYLFLGRMLDQAGAHLPEITRDYQDWLARDGQNAKAQLLLAKALLAADSKSEKAEPLLRMSIKSDASDWESHYELGVLLANEHKYREAAEQLAAGISLAPNQPEPHYHLSRVYDRLGEPDRAKAEREVHQRLTPSSIHQQ
ncbi:MAG: tetratricopeptide repeat protein [Acidobacteriota bacterium]|nr:tetratricopeptide repeat protein [Acidobacteriota bacterium]